MKSFGHLLFFDHLTPPLSPKWAEREKKALR